MYRELHVHILGHDLMGFAFRVLLGTCTLHKFRDWRRVYGHQDYNIFAILFCCKAGSSTCARIHGHFFPDYRLPIEYLPGDLSSPSETV